MRKLVLIDALGILYRGHYAMIKRPLKGTDGTVTSGLSHLLSEMIRMIEENPDSVVVVAGDAPGPTFRSEIFSDYKANRPPMPEELREETRLARLIIPLMGIPFLEHSGLEADDIIAGLSSVWTDPVLIVSPDKDLLQLVSNRVTVVRPGRYGGAATVVKEGDVKRIMGVPAEKVPDLLALMGDSSDNIPGARGIGARTASTLLGSYDSVEDIYERIDSVEPPSLRKKLEDSRDRVLLSRRLVLLDRELPGEILDSDLEMKDPDTERLTPLLERLSLGKAAAFTGVNLVKTRDKGTEEFICKVTMASSPEELIMEGDGPLAVDTETTSRDPALAELIGFSVSAEPETAVYVHWKGRDAGEPFLQVLEKEIARRGFIAQNAKYDARVLNRYGLELPPPSGDPYLADYLLRPEAREHSLKKLVPLWLGKRLRTYGEVSDESGSLAGTPAEEVAQYCGSDSASTLALSMRLDRELNGDRDLRNVYRRIELPLCSVLGNMETTGIGLDREALRQEGERISVEIARLLRTAEEQAGVPVNLASPGQVASILFDRLGLEPVRKTARGARSTGMTVLEALRGSHPFVDTLIEFRELSKLLNTYIEKLPKYLNPETGLIHTSFNQAVTATGRLSSSNPNMQNIPIRTRRGRAIRRCFIPPRTGEVFVTADYSQIELRILAHFAGEGALSRAYREKADIHSRTAEAVFGDSTPEHRRKAKEVNFSIIYGISAYGLSQRLSISRGEASGIISRYYDTYPEVRSFYDATVKEAEKTGEIRTILGRRRPFESMDTASGAGRKQMERAAVNTRVQGSAADIIKQAMINASARFSKELPQASLVLQVHDELVVSCPGEMADAASSILTREMENAIELSVPLTVESGTGNNWLAAGH